MTLKRFSWAVPAQLFLLLLLFAGCGGNPPELLQLFWQKNITKELDSAGRTEYETLSLWLNVSDEDGTEDLAYLYLIHDTEELYWELTDEDWHIREQSGDTWVGTNEIVMEDRSPFPPGGYRAVLIDAAGDRDERQFFISAGPGEYADLIFPVLEPAADGFTFSSPHRENTLRVYDTNGNLRGSFDIEAGDFSAEKDLAGLLNQPAQDDRPGGGAEVPGDTEGSQPLRLYAYSYDDARGVGLISGPYRYPADS